MITVGVPESWQDLQVRVAQILRQCGFDVNVEQVLELGRGKAEIDVYAEELHRGRLNRIICECKYWKSAVPQQVVHAFRTISADVGANAGYIIALNRFQAGAYEAVARTNVRLVTWEEFQAEFEATWLEAYFSPVLTKELDALMSYTEPLAPAWFGNLLEIDQHAYVALVMEHTAIGVLAMRLSTYHQKLNPGDFPPLPLREQQIAKDIPDLPDSVLDAGGYAELASTLLELGKAAIDQFRIYRGRGLARAQGVRV